MTILGSFLAGLIAVIMYVVGGDSGPFDHTFFALVALTLLAAHFLWEIAPWENWRKRQQ